MTSLPDPRQPEFVTESRDSIIVEFNDSDYPWTPVPDEERDALLRKIRSPLRPKPPSTPPAPEPPTE
jgi:hypothetical protein